MLGWTLCDRRFGSVPPPLPWVFVGLGNAGDKYRGTRHNIGFDTIDALADSLDVPVDRVHCKALFGEVCVGWGNPGLSRQAADLHEPLWRVCWTFGCILQTSIELGCVGIKHRYSFHGNREFPRLRIGIGRPPGQMDPKAFLLQKFNATAQERIDTALQGVEILKFLIDKGFTEAAKGFNTRQKYKHIRLQTMEVLFFKQLFQEPVWTN